MTTSMMKVDTQVGGGDESDDVFDLDVSLVEMADPAGLVNVTDDGCTSTCGACITGAA